MLGNNWHRKEMPLVSLIGMGGGIASPAFLASIVLNILKPTVFSPADDTGVPDFVYEAASSAIANVGSVEETGPGSVGSGSFTGDTDATTYVSSVYDPDTQKLIVVYADEGGSFSGNGGPLRAVVATVSGTSISFGSPSTLSGNTVRYTSIAYDSTNDKVVIAYQDQSASGVGKAVVGTVSGTSISFGTPVTFSGSDVGDFSAITYDSNAQKIVIAYREYGSGYSGVGNGRAIVGTVSGTSISFGSSTIFAAGSGGASHISLVYHPIAQKVVLTCSDDTNSGYPTSRVGTVSGTSISFGTAVVINSTNGMYVRSLYDPDTEKVIVAYVNHSNSSYGTAKVGTVSGTSISFGSASVFNAGSTVTIAMAYDANTRKSIICFSDRGNSDKGTFVSGTVSGTSISFSSETIFTDEGTWDTAPVYDSSAQKVAVFHTLKGSSRAATSKIIGTTGFSIPSVGSPAVYNTGSSVNNSATYDSANQKVVVAYTDNGSSGEGTAVVGTVSGTSISFGTPVVFESGNSTYISATFDSTSNKVVIAYRDQGNSNYGTAVVGTVSGTSISFGTPVVFEYASTEHLSAVYDSSNEKVVIAYKDDANSDYGTAIVGTVSGTSISFGSPVVFEAADIEHVSAVYDSANNKVVIAYEDNGNNQYGTAIVGTVSGTSISFGSPTVFETSAIYNLKATYDSTNSKAVITYTATSDYGWAVVGTVSGTSISFGTPVAYSSVITGFSAATFDSANDKVVIIYSDGGNSQYGTAVVGTVSGTSISFGSPIVFESAATYHTAATFDSNNEKVVMAYADAGSSYHGTAVVFSPVSSATQLTLTDTTVSKVSDGTLVEGTTIDEVLTVGETVQADTAVASTVTAPVFSTTLYKGNSSSGGSGQTQNVDTGINLDDGDGLIIFKQRTGSQPWRWHDTIRGIDYALESHNDGAQFQTDQVSVNSTGFTVGAQFAYNQISGVDPNNLEKHVAWTFRKAPGFFDIVTWSGNDVRNRAIPHSLGTTPGCIIVKELGTREWYVYHSGSNIPWTGGTTEGDTSGSSDTGALVLDKTDAFNSSWGIFTYANSTAFGVWRSNSELNYSGGNYVAYVFADDTPGLIKCGSYSGNGSTQTIDCGFKPEWVMIKKTNGPDSWEIWDSARNNATGHTPYLAPNNDGSEIARYGQIQFTSNGFTSNGTDDTNGSGREFIFIAIAENAEADITSDIYASGTVSASSGNTITLSNTTGTWSTGMKVQGVDSDTKDNPDPIKAENVSLTSSAPTAERNVNTWGDAVWEIATDENFTQNVQTATTALSATGTQAGPSFTLEAETGYYTRTKYTALGQESEWSDVTYFVTGSLPVYADDVFSTYLYDGTGSTQSINNGIDLSGEAGMVWVKCRSDAADHRLIDTERGANNILTPNTTSANFNNSTIFSSFNSDGFSVATDAATNWSGRTYASWTFRKAPGFFDVVTWTGDGTSGRAISHGLGSTPGMVIVKCTNASTDWPVWHRSLPNVASDYFLRLNTPDAEGNPYQAFFGTPDASNFYVGANEAANGSGNNYVAYVFAHDDQSFGTNGDESIIKCGSFTTDSSANATVNLGWEPQWVFTKKTNAYGSSALILDSMRGYVNGGNDGYLMPDTTQAEGSFDTGHPTATGFAYKNAPSSTYVYVAIRRPHKPPTVATDVFAVNTRAGTSADTSVTGIGFAPDLVTTKTRTSPTQNNEAFWYDRLRGNFKRLKSNTTSAESGTTTGYALAGTTQGTADIAQLNNINRSGDTIVDWFFRRAPGFFDVVAYTGTGSARTLNHNLEAIPELVIVKNRENASYGWSVYLSHLSSPRDKAFYLNDTMAAQTNNAGTFWGNSDFTSTQISLGSYANTNHNNIGMIAYLFASLDGISKVGTYSGTGSNINVDCGFAAGSRFVLIKRTDSSGDWYVWDTERGIVSGNDPYLTLNTTDAEVTNTDYIDPLNAGFTVTSSAPAALNASGGTYLFLAIA